jgi:ankyrin repeat protein
VVIRSAHATKQQEYHDALRGASQVKDVKADHVVREVISELQTANPKRKREASDITELDAAEKELDGRLKKHKRRRLRESEENVNGLIFPPTEEDDDSYSDGSDSDWSDDSGSDIDVDHLDEATGNLLVAVANFEDFDELEELLESGANVNGQDGAERTALHHAVLEDLDELIEYLVNAGADTEIVDANGETPLMMAVNVQSYECLEKLLECHANVETTGFDGDTPLHSAAEQCNEEMLRTLLDFGANVDARNAEMLTPVMTAVQDGDHDDFAAQVVRILIQNGADSGAKDLYGYTALLRAVDRNMLHCVTELVRAGVDVDEIDASGCTALHHACSRHAADEDNYYDCTIEIVESLVSSGSADVNVVTRDAMSAPLIFEAPFPFLPPIFSAPNSDRTFYDTSVARINIGRRRPCISS